MVRRFGCNICRIFDDRLQDKTTNLSTRALDKVINFCVGLLRNIDRNVTSMLLLSFKNDQSYQFEMIMLVLLSQLLCVHRQRPHSQTCSQRWVRGRWWYHTCSTESAWVRKAGLDRHCDEMTGSPQSQHSRPIKLTLISNRFEVDILLAFSIDNLSDKFETYYLRVDMRFFKI